MKGTQLTTFIALLSQNLKALKVFFFSLEGNTDQETAQTRNPYEEQLLPSLVMD